MLKFLLGILTGVVLVFGGLYGTFRYMQSSHGQLNRCMNLYLENSDDLRKDPSVLEAMQQGGFQTFEDIIKDRCQHWIKNGQKF